MACISLGTHYTTPEGGGVNSAWLGGLEFFKEGITLPYGLAIDKLLVAQLGWVQGEMCSNVM